MLELSLLGVGTVLRLERDTWSNDYGKQQMSTPPPCTQYKKKTRNNAKKKHSNIADDATRPALGAAHPFGFRMQL